MNRFLINSTMLSSLKAAADGSVTLHLQKQTPDKNEEANWIPTPSGKFMVIMRMYWPKEEVVDGKWTVPPVRQVN
jgi:hypothetical protein